MSRRQQQHQQQQHLSDNDDDSHSDHEIDSTTQQMSGMVLDVQKWELQENLKKKNGEIRSKWLNIDEWLFDNMVWQVTCKWSTTRCNIKNWRIYSKEKTQTEKIEWKQFQLIQTQRNGKPKNQIFCLFCCWWIFQLLIELPDGEREEINVTKQINSNRQTD